MTLRFLGVCRLVAFVFLLWVTAGYHRTASAQVPVWDEVREQMRDPVFGRGRNHMGATILIDGYRDGTAPITFEPVTRPTQSVFWNPPFMRDTEKDGHFVFYAHATSEVWRPYRLKLMPKADGLLRLVFSSAGGGGIGGNYADYDFVQAWGHDFENGSFENLNEAGVPVGWGPHVLEGTRDQPMVIENPKEAVEGSRFIRVPSWRGYEKTIEVQKGETLTLTYWARMANLEEHFAIRIGLNPLMNASPVELKTKKGDLPEGGRLWSLNRWRAEWGPNPWSFHSASRSAGAQSLFLPATGDWQEYAVTITPVTEDEVIELELTLHAIRSIDRDQNHYRKVWVEYKNLSVEGGELESSDFDAGWKAVGRDPNGAKISVQDGETRLRTWYQAGKRGLVTNIKSGEPFTLRFEARTVQ